jgi:pimeloyl-ACP methyl ester carboxylesterase
MADAALEEQFARVGDVELCYSTFGDPGNPAMLLVMGLGTQMLAWRPGFCEALAARGFHVIRYDNRDVGRSTHFKGTPPPGPIEMLTRRPRNLAYTLDDMADDGIRLLDELGIARAHVVGASMGGMIAQVMAGRHPDRVLSLTSIMSTTGNGRVGQPALRVYPFFLGRLPRDRDAYVERIVKLFRVVGSPGFERDEDDLRTMAGASYDRDPKPSGTPRQLAAIMAAGDRTADVKRIEAPTLVIHGTDDRLVSSSGGVATVRAIRGARLMLVEGMGHDLPEGAWPRIIDGIVENAARAAETEVAAWRRT